MSGLRALLIQKDVKPTTASTFKGMRLRALLIQKDVKLATSLPTSPRRLRALLIQKDVKHHYHYYRHL